MKKKYFAGLKNTSIAMDARLYASVKYINEVSRTFSLSEEVEKTVIKTLENFGDRDLKVSERPFDLLIEMYDEKIALLQAERAKIITLKERNQERISRSLVDQEAPKPEDVKKSYVFDTFHEINDWYPNTLIASDPERFKPPTENAAEPAHA